MSPLILSEIKEPVGTLTLNRPGRHNSLVPELLQEMLRALETLRAEEIRAVVVKAAGRSFSTGGDVRAFYEHLDDGLVAYANEVVSLLNRVLLTFLTFPVPIVTAVHGLVTGGAMGFVAAADIVLVAPEASFTPYYNLVGYSPDGGWTALVPRLIGERRAAELLLCNRTMSAEEAVAWGLASRLVPADRIEAEAETVATTIARMRPGSVKRTKALLRADYEAVAFALERERRAFIEQITTEEARRGMMNFLHGGSTTRPDRAGAKGSKS